MGRHAGNAAEKLAKMCLIAHAAGVSDLAQRFIGRAYQILSESDASGQDIGIGCFSEGNPEIAGEMARTQMDQCTEIRDPEARVNVLLDMPDNLSDLPACQTIGAIASRQFRWL